MATLWKYQIDFDGDGFFCEGVQPSDPLNLLPTPDDFSGLSVVASPGDINYPRSNLAPYGVAYISGQVDASLTGGVTIGKSTVADEIPVDPSTQYNFSCYIAGLSLVVPMQIDIYDQTNTLLASSSSFTPSSNVTIGVEDFERKNVTFTTGAGSTHIYIRIRKVNSTTQVSIWTTGLMLVEGASPPDAVNMGHPTNAYDDITGYVKRSRWSLGMREAWQNMADEPTATIELVSPEREFSPEAGAAGSMAESLKPMRTVRVSASTDGGATYNTLWTGYIKQIAPTPMQYQGPYLTVLECEGLKHLLEQNTNPVPYLEDFSVGDAIQQVIVGEQGEYTYPPVLELTYDFDTDDDTVIPFFGGNFDEGMSVYEAISHLVKAERGKFFFSRSGALTFWSRYHTQKDTSDPVQTFNNAFHDIDYVYGDDIINEVIVSTYPRRLSATNSEVLWELDEAFELEGGTDEEITVNFNDGSPHWQVSARDVNDPVITYSSPTGATVVLVSFRAFSQDARIKLRSSDENKSVTVETITVTGQSIKTHNGLQLVRQDQDSIDAYGRRTEELDLKLMTKRVYSRYVAQDILLRRANPIGRVRSITLKNVDDSYETTMLTRTIGDKIAVSEFQTGHSGTYYIVGEEWEWLDSGLNISTTFYLEPIAPYSSWILDETGYAELDSGTYLGF